MELKAELEALRETNTKLTEANLVIAKQLENLWSEVGYKNDRVRDLTYEVSELKLKTNNSNTNGKNVLLISGLRERIKKQKTLN